MIVKNLTSKVLKSIFFLAIFSLWTVVLMAQCNLTGTVVPAGKGGCDVWIKLEDGTLLQPVNRLDKLRESQEIEFSYSLNVPITACTGATAININCLKIVKEAITCKAKFEANYIGVDTNGHVTVKFSNQSYGEYKYVELNFGDGGFVTDFSEDIYYTYTKPGLYEACLIVSSDECSSETCQHLLAGSNSLICTTSDCVYPGDANKDGRANLYDLLMLGVGNKKTGPERPNSSTEWSPQAAPNWTNSTPKGINYKHFDCDGDGSVSDIDLAAINTNYTPCIKSKAPIVNGSPHVRLVFEKDSIQIERGSGKLGINARLEVVGDVKNQIPIYGIAVYLRYNSSQVNDLFVQYNDASFLGAEEDVLWSFKDQPKSNQLDLAASKVGGKGVKESGAIAFVTSIVDADIIMKANPSGHGQFEIELEGGVVVDENGNEYQIITDKNNSKVVLVDAELTSGNKDINNEIKMQMFPNPAREEVKFVFPNAKASKLEFYNALGGRISTINLADVQNFSFPVVNYAPGVYVCKFTTNKGVVIRHLAVK